VSDSKDYTYIFGYFVWNSWNLAPRSQVFINNDPQKFRWSNLNYGYFIDINGFDGDKLFLSEDNIMKLVFSKLRDNLFALNQSAIMISSEFIISIRWSRDLWDKKIFVSSANKMYLMSREVVDRSFMYSDNKNGPSIEPWGTPQVINSVNDAYPL